MTQAKQKKKANGFSFDRIKRLTGDNQDLFTRVIYSFKELIEEIMPILENYPEEISDEHLVRCVHDAKPTLDYFGMTAAKNCYKIKEIIQNDVEGNVMVEIRIILKQLNEFNAIVEAYFKNNW